MSDEIPGIGAAFMRCSTDRHNLLVQPGPFAFLHHTAWEMDDVDEDRTNSATRPCWSHCSSYPFFSQNL